MLVSWLTDRLRPVVALLAVAVLAGPSLDAVAQQADPPAKRQTPPKPSAKPRATPAPKPGAAPSVASIATAAASPPPASAGSGGGFYVQTGAFSTPGNAEKQRGMITSYGTSEISQASSGGRELYRVRLGPYTTQEAAGIVADRLKRSGYGDARVVAD